MKHAILLLFPVAIIAQSLGVDAPIAGYVLDKATSSLRPILGLPGGSTLGPSTVSGVESATVGPDFDTAIVSKPSGAFAITGIRSAAPQWTQLSDSKSYLAAWGPSSAVVYADRGFSVITRPAKGPLIITKLGVGLPPGIVTSLDYDEGSQTAYIGLEADDSTGGVYAFFVPDGTLKQLISLSGPTSIVHANRQVFALDRRTSAIWNITDSPTQLPISMGTDSRITAIAVSSDSLKLYLADTGLQRLLVFDLTGTLLSQIPTSTSPAKLERLSNGASFLLNDQSGRPVWLLDDSKDPSIFFIPALRASEIAVAERAN